MSTYKNHWFDVIVECDYCHDLYDCEIQLFSKREVELVKELLSKLITECHYCGADKNALVMTVSNEYFTGDEINNFRKG